MSDTSGRDIRVDDRGYFMGLILGDKVEFVTSEMDGLWGSGKVASVIEDGLYVISVEGQDELRRFLEDANRFDVSRFPGGWTVELDGTAIKYVQKGKEHV